MICCAYRHPSTEIENFTEYLQRFLSSSLAANKYVFILGDHHINLLTYNSHTPTCDFVSVLLSQHYLPYIIHPTRVSDHSSTIIDNIFSNVCNVHSGYKSMETMGLKMLFGSVSRRLGKDVLYWFRAKIDADMTKTTTLVHEHIFFQNIAKFIKFSLTY